MTTDWRAKLREPVERRSNNSIYDKVLSPINRSVTSFEQIGRGETGWIAADAAAPKLFQRNPQDLEQDLQAIWRKHGGEALMPLAKPIAKLADRARKRQLESDNEVSTDVYAMQ